MLRLNVGHRTVFHTLTDGSMQFLVSHVILDFWISFQKFKVSFVERKIKELENHKSKLYGTDIEWQKAISGF